MNRMWEIGKAWHQSPKKKGKKKGKRERDAQAKVDSYLFSLKLIYFKLNKQIYKNKYNVIF